MPEAQKQLIELEIDFRTQLSGNYNSLWLFTDFQKNPFRRSIVAGRADIWSRHFVILMKRIRFPINFGLPAPKGGKTGRRVGEQTVVLGPEIWVRSEKKLEKRVW